MVTNETQEQLEARGWDFTEEFIPDEPTVNNQDKTVDVSENGTIEVMPDESFTGLGKVTVNTNVESTSTDSWKYYLLNWGDLYDDPLYDRTAAIQALREIQECFAALVVVDFSTVLEISIGFSTSFDIENFQLYKYLALKYDGGQGLQPLIGIELTPKLLLESLAAQFPFTKVLADNMTECSRAEYEAKMKSN